MMRKMGEKELRILAKREWKLPSKRDDLIVRNFGFSICRSSYYMYVYVKLNDN